MKKAKNLIAGAVCLALIGMAGVAWTATTTFSVSDLNGTYAEVFSGFVVGGGTQPTIDSPVPFGTGTSFPEDWNRHLGGRWKRQLSGEIAHYCWRPGVRWNLGGRYGRFGRRRFPDRIHGELRWKRSRARNLHPLRIPCGSPARTRIRVSGGWRSSGRILSDHQSPRGQVHLNRFRYDVERNRDAPTVVTTSVRKKIGGAFDRASCFSFWYFGRSRKMIVVGRPREVSLRRSDARRFLPLCPSR